MEYHTYSRPRDCVWYMWMNYMYVCCSPRQADPEIGIQNYFDEMKLKLITSMIISQHPNGSNAAFVPANSPWFSTGELFQMVLDFSETRITFLF